MIKNMNLFINSKLINSSFNRSVICICQNRSFNTKEPFKKSIIKIKKQIAYDKNDKNSLKLNNQNVLINKIFYTNFSTTTQNNFNKEWNRTLTKAEKVVGYPTSFLNLRYLVSDEVANFANLLRKLMKTKHPMIKMARRLISNSSENETKRSLQINGLIVLLIAKAAGIPKQANFLEVDISDGIHNSQRCLAEITEMIYMGSLIHKGILDIKTVDKSEYKEMDQGNKLAVLCGDYLLASACTNLSKLRNIEVVDLMSQVIADISQSIFASNRSPKFSFLKLWYETNYNNTSSLLSNSAKSAMLLVSHSPKLQQVASEFAKQLDFTYKIWSDISDFKKDENALNNPDTILNAIYKDKYFLDDSSNKIESNKNDKIESSTTSPNSISATLMSSIYSTFSNKTKPNSFDENLLKNVVEDSKIIFQNHYKLAMDSLEQLENEYSEKDAIASLKSILIVMKNTV